MYIVQIGLLYLEQYVFFGIANIKLYLLWPEGFYILLYWV